MAKVLSTEDQDLSGKSIRSSRNTVYSDIDLSLAKNTTTNDIFKKKDAAAVKQAVLNLIQTGRFEKPFRPSFGANIANQLFELSIEETASDLEDQIKSSIERFEPRAKIRQLIVKSNTERNTLSVFLEFQILNTSEIVSFETSLSRLR
jgi:phage baseplate assembly protein W|tara:strand:- start:3153 stop:3596 length:444 start_codon:yes stop_codon:yes gene_type:complete